MGKDEHHGKKVEKEGEDMALVEKKLIGLG